MTTADEEVPLMNGVGAGLDAATGMTRYGRIRSAGLVLAARFGLPLTVLVLFAFFAIYLGARFASVDNLAVVAQNTALVGMLGLSVTVVLVMWDFDLSVGATASLTSIVAGSLTAADAALRFALGGLIGGAVGVLNGLLVALFGLPAFVATLAVGSVIDGVGTRLVEHGYVVLLPGSSMYGLATRTYLGFPFEFLFLIFAAVIVAVFLRQTRMGRSMVAIGDDAKIARLRGVPIRRYRFLAYILTGCLAGLFGVLLMSHLGNATIGQGQSYLLDAYAAALIGVAVGRTTGVSVLGTIFGAGFLGILSDGMALAALSPAMIQLAKAVILIAGLASVGATRNLRFRRT